MIHLPPPPVSVHDTNVLFITPGETTRDEIIRKLGEPNILNGRFISVYEWRTGPGILVGVIGLYGNATTTGRNRSRLLVQFDDAGKVRHFRFAEYHLPGLFIKEPPPSYFTDGTANEIQEPPAPLLQPARIRAGCGDDQCFAFAVSRDGRYVADSTLDAANVQVWDLTSGISRTFASGLKPSGFFRVLRSARTIDISLDGKLLAAAAIDDATVLWDMASGKRLQLLRGHGKETFAALAGATAIKFAPDGRSVATGGRDGTVKIWDVASGNEESSIRVDGGTVQSLAFSPQGDLLAVGTSRGDVVLADLKSGQQIRLATGSDAIEHGRSVAFSASGERLAANSCVDVEVWPVDKIREEFTQIAASGRPLLADKPRDPEAALLLPYGNTQWSDSCRALLEFSPDDRLLIASSTADQISVWQVNPYRLRYAWNLNLETWEPAGLMLGRGASLLITPYSGGDIKVIDLVPIIRESMEGTQSEKSKEMAR